MNDSSRALIILGVLLALGMSVAAYLLGMQTKQIGGGRQTITVKGLAEKPVKADIAEWTVGSSIRGDTEAQALARLREKQPRLREFLAAQGFADSVVRAAAEQIKEHFEEEETRSGEVRNVRRGYDASQSLVITTKDLSRIEAAAAAIVQFQVDGNPVYFGAPLFLVSGLEEVKMSLIGAATQNAKARAEEFAKNGGGTKLGPMRSASQGSFYILPARADNEVSDYAGTYDKSTIDKKARVVVTIEYGIQ
jgi:hypothetical protein